MNVPEGLALITPKAELAGDPLAQDFPAQHVGSDVCTTLDRRGPQACAGDVPWLQLEGHIHIMHHLEQADRPLPGAFRQELLGSRDAVSLCQPTAGS